MSDAAIKAALTHLPTWGPHPDSNRWSEIEYVEEKGERHIHGGEALRSAIRAGLVEASHHPGRGLDIGDGLICDWRYHAAVERAASTGEGGDE